MRKLILVGLALSVTACSNREVTDLKAQITALRAQVQALQAENAALQAQVNAAGSANAAVAERAAMAYSIDVYKAAAAAIAEDPTYTPDKLASEHPTCTHGVTINTYTVMKVPASVQSCIITSSDQDVVVMVTTATHTYVNGSLVR